MENRLAKISAMISVIFLVVLVIIFEKIPAYHEKVKADSTIVTQKSEKEIGYGNMEMNYDDNLQIPLPGNVRPENVKVYIKMIYRKVNITFEVKDNIFDVSSMVNTAGREVSNISYSAANDKISIDVTLNNYYKVFWSVKGSILYMRFLDITPEDTVVVIDAGHGDYDVGANLGTIYEKNITLDICRILKQKTADDKFVIFFTREDDSYPTVEERVDFVNAIKPELFISIHCNWYDGGGDINGTEVLYNVNDTASINSSQWLAQIMEDEVTKACGTYKKGLVEGNSIHIVRNSSVPVALVEVAYMTNQKDLELLNSDEGKEKAAQGIYDGICEALKQLGKIK